jgi:hypothetical protein
VRLDPKPFSLPRSNAWAVPSVRYPFLRRRHPFSSHPYVPSTYVRRSAPLLLDYPRSYQHTLPHSYSGVSAGKRNSSPFPPRLSWRTALSSLPHAHARAGALCKAPFSRPTATIVLSYSGATSTFGHCSIPIILHSLRSSVHTSHHPCSGVSYRKCLVLLGYDCPGTLLFPLFPTPILHPYHRILMILGCMLRTNMVRVLSNIPLPPVSVHLSPRVLCHHFPFSSIRAHLSTRYLKFLLYAACQLSTLSTPRGLPNHALSC